MSSRAPHTRPCAWVAEPWGSDVDRSLRRLADSDDIVHLAVMPDVHLAHDVCIGVVAATSHLIYPAAVGGDIGCGMAAMRVNADANLLAGQRNAARLLARLYRHVPVNRHSAEAAPAKLPAELTAATLSHDRLETLKRRDGRVQFGTLGRGNHFLEFQADGDGQLWVLVHSGSRAMGQAITAHHTRHTPGCGQGFCVLESESREGRDYLADVAWGVKYAHGNRLAMLAAVEAVLEDLFRVQLDRETLIHTDHNHVRQERHFAKPLWVHRKGAQSARQGEAALVPGSMGSSSFHVVGRGCPESLCSCSHGAGRKMSREAARRAVSVGGLRRQVGSVWFDHRRARGLCDEAPSAYKDIWQVMRAQRELASVVREVQPVLCYKGGGSPRR